MRHSCNETHTQTIRHTAQILAWIGILTHKVAEALQAPLEASTASMENLAQQTRILHREVSLLREDIHDLVEVQITQAETLQRILNSRKGR